MQLQREMYWPYTACKLDIMMLNKTVLLLLLKCNVSFSRSDNHIILMPAATDAVSLLYEGAGAR